VCVPLHLSEGQQTTTQNGRSSFDIKCTEISSLHACNACVFKIGANLAVLQKIVFNDIFSRTGSGLNTSGSGQAQAFWGLGASLVIQV
jgi:hypothetical protein